MAYIMEVLGQIGGILAAAETVIVIVSAVLGALAMFIVLNYFFEAIACWRIFEKAGKHGWKSLIPIYSNYIRYQIAWRPLWFWISSFLLAASVALNVWGGTGRLWSSFATVVSVMGTLVHLTGNYRLGRAFGRGVLFSVGLALLPTLFTLILGLGGSEYQRPTERTGNGETQEKTTP